MIASMGLLIFMTGEPGRRVITPEPQSSHTVSLPSTSATRSQLIAGRKEDLEHERILSYQAYSNAQENKEELESTLRDVDT